MDNSSQVRGVWRIPGASARPWRRAISASVLTAALTDPAPIGAKGVTTDGARNCVMNTDGHPVARLMFGGAGAANTILNWQAILWTQVTSSLNIEGWIGRVIANGTATLGAETYAVAGLGTTDNRLADTITDTIGFSRKYSPADDTIAVIEIPLINAQRLELQTDLPAASAVTNADVWVQLGEKADISPSAASFNVGLVNAAEVEIDPATEDKQDDIIAPLGTTADAPLAGETAEGATARTTVSLLKRTVNKLIDLKTLLGWGQTSEAASLPVTIATDDAVIGAVDAAVVDAGAVGSVSSKLRRLTTDMGAIAADTNELTDAPVAKVPVAIVKALAGTPAPLALAASETYVTSFTVEAARADGVNTGNVFVGLIADLVSGTKNYYTLEPGEAFSYTCRAGTKVNLALFGVDGETATDGVIGIHEPV